MRAMITAPLALECLRERLKKFETFEIPLNNSLMAGFEKRLGKDGLEHLALN